MGPIFKRGSPILSMLINVQIKEGDLVGAEIPSEVYGRVGFIKRV